MMGIRHPRKRQLTRENGREGPNVVCYYASVNAGRTHSSNRPTRSSGCSTAWPSGSPSPSTSSPSPSSTEAAIARLCPAVWLHERPTDQAGEPYSKGPWTGLNDVEFATMGYNDWFNHRRLHGEITDDNGYVTPPRSSEPRTTVRQRPPSRRSPIAGAVMEPGGFRITGKTLCAKDLTALARSVRRRSPSGYSSAYPSGRLHAASEARRAALPEAIRLE